MTKMNTITAISIIEQRAIRRWYISTVRLAILLTLVLLCITLINIYCITTHIKPCMPHIDQSHIQGIKQKHTRLYAQMQSTKKITNLQEHGEREVRAYIAILAAHREKPSLASMTMLQLSPSVITATYITQSLASIKIYTELLREISVLTKITLVSLDHDHGITCTINAELSTASK